MNYDISKACKELGFVPEIGVEEGVKQTVRWCQDNENAVHSDDIQLDLAITS
jgi:nucleoside-diphosphate-sugar epimerase